MQCVQCCVEQLSSDASYQQGGEQNGLEALVLLGGEYHPPTYREDTRVRFVMMAFA